MDLIVTYALIVVSDYHIAPRNHAWKMPILPMRWVTVLLSLTLLNFGVCDALCAELDLERYLSDLRGAVDGRGFSFTFRRACARAGTHNSSAAPLSATTTLAECELRTSNRERRRDCELWTCRLCFCELCFVSTVYAVSIFFF